MGMKCYDGGTCVQASGCKLGDCAVREQVQLLRSEVFEQDKTQRLGYTGEDTEIIEGEVYEFVRRDDLSLSEEEVAGLQRRFEKVQGRAYDIWTQSDTKGNIYSHTHPKHRCLACWLVSLLPGHHRCPHGRLVCEQCELEAAG